MVGAFRLSPIIWKPYLRGYTGLRMTLDTLIMLAGAFVAGLPFLGFPNTWDTALFFAAGVFVIGLGIVVRRRGVHIGVPRDVRMNQRSEPGAPLQPDTPHASN
jgi:hypothetical protein